MAVNRVTINKNVLLKDLVRGKNAVTINKIVKVHFVKKAKIAQKKFIVAFKKNKITIELSGASPEKNTNISGTLGGYGNLFSFIGFPIGSNPISLVEGYISAPIDVKIRNFGNGKFTINPNFITKEELYNKSDLEIPWQEGRGWLDGIEFGIAGFGSYIYSKSGRFRGQNNRSKHGIQLKSSKGGRFRNQTYMSPLFKEFIRELKK